MTVTADGAVVVPVPVLVVAVDAPTPTPTPTPAPPAMMGALLRSSKDTVLEMEVGGERVWGGTVEVGPPKGKEADERGGERSEEVVATGTVE